ncbi:unnamed protein product [Staurois parvus]|uniref:Uncharacterized protein n=1 Tax=Staurois parvus TaxID=386267 RepID=A0ABN9AV38_9NEOB|nr:unnamed protein product [Staurois parvus]
MHTDHQGTDDQCALMISVAPAVPPVSVHQCQLSVPTSAHQCHISVPTSAHQCHISVSLSVPVSATYQCQSVPPISTANQLHLSVPVSAAFQCQSV